MNSTEKKTKKTEKETIEMCILDVEWYHNWGERD